MTDLLNDRFEILGELGRGAQAITYRARDTQTDDVVAIKELDFRRVSDWKAHELFEREAETLRSLDHSAIPRYVDAFTREEDDTVRLFLVQEFVDGPTLAEELESGTRWDEVAARRDAKTLLEALRYLHELNPPVIHRDIKPSNIIRRPDGRLALIDFGAVQNALPTTVGGSTVIGTPGYMPMEQVMGRAVPGSDLYALAATLVHLLSRTEPSALPAPRNRIQFRERVSVSGTMADLLDEMLSPSAEDRPESAAEVLHRLRAETIVARRPEPSDDQPLAELERPDWLTGHARRDEEESFALRMGDESGRLADVRVEAGPRRLRVRSRWNDRNSGAGFQALVLVLVVVALLVGVAILGSFGAGFAFSTAIGLTALVLLLSSVYHARFETRFEIRDGRLLPDDGSPGYDDEVVDVLLEGDWLVAQLADGRQRRLLSTHPRDDERRQWLVRFLATYVRNQQTPRLPAATAEAAEEEFWKELPVEH